MSVATGEDVQVVGRVSFPADVCNSVRMSIWVVGSQVCIEVYLDTRLTTRHYLDSIEVYLSAHTHLLGMCARAVGQRLHYSAVTHHFVT